MFLYKKVVIVTLTNGNKFKVSISLQTQFGRKRILLISNISYKFAHCLENSLITFKHTTIRSSAAAMVKQKHFH